MYIPECVYTVDPLHLKALFACHSKTLVPVYLFKILNMPKQAEEFLHQNGGSKQNVKKREVYGIKIFAQYYILL